MAGRPSNYRVLLASTTVLSFSLGLFVPFWIVFIQDFGGSIESFGIAIGLMALVQSITSYVAGKHSDKLGRKRFMIAAGLALVIITIAYTLITKIWHLYVLQVLIGIAQAVQMTMEATMLGDYTEKARRGTDIGKYHAITGVLGALAMMGGGYVVGILGITIIFYLVAGFFLASTLLLLPIKE
ncbi:MFS transporter [Candidatus Woesearchaeota archaeon]|nr:MFS transporter [Candidatus Woesearchaeota archaeon]